MIIEYEEKYIEEVKDLLVELQEYIVDLDKEKYNIITKEYRELYFKEKMEEMEKYNGKIYLYEENGKILGLVMGIITNEETDTYDFKAPKRGRVTELIVDKKARLNGIGNKLLDKIEEYLKSKGCKAILIEVFGYNENALKFYDKNGYRTRLVDVIKVFNDK